MAELCFLNGHFTFLRRLPKKSGKEILLTEETAFLFEAIRATFYLRRALRNLEGSQPWLSVFLGNCKSDSKLTQETQKVIITHHQPRACKSVKHVWSPADWSSLLLRRELSYYKIFLLQNYGHLSTMNYATSLLSEIKLPESKRKGLYLLTLAVKVNASTQGRPWEWPSQPSTATSTPRSAGFHGVMLLVCFLVHYSGIGNHFALGWGYVSSKNSQPFRSG